MKTELAIDDDEEAEITMMEGKLSDVATDSADNPPPPPASARRLPRLAEDILVQDPWLAGGRSGRFWTSHEGIQATRR